ncbi:MAG: MFS transporter [Candidatus Faecousia sp.]|nr:MFS transporter [Candidatus Faecousia sp.]
MERKSIWNRNYTLVFLCNILTAFSFHILTPTIPKYVLALGGGVELAGFAATAFSITAILTRPFVGYYINIKRKKVILTAALVIVACSILGYALSGSVAMILLFRLLHGVGWGMVTTANSTVLVASIGEDQIGRGIGLFGIASSLASVFAPNLGLQLIQGVGYRWMFLISFALAVAGCLMSLGVDENAMRKSQAPHGKLNVLEHLFAREAVVPAVVILCVGAGMASITNFIAIYAESLSVSGIGYYFTVAGAVMLVMRPLFGRLSDSRFSRTIVFVSLAGFSLVFLTLGLARTLPVFLVAAVLYGTFYGALCPILQTWCVKAVDVSKSGTANSTYYTALDIGQALGASAAGLLSVRMSYSNMYFTVMIPQLLAIALVAVVTLRERAARK